MNGMIQLIIGVSAMGLAFTAAEELEQALNK
jgi:hypothetical protein